MPANPENSPSPLSDPASTSTPSAIPPASAPPPPNSQPPGPPAEIAYLGPHGTFTEQALLTQDDWAGAVRRQMPSIADALMCAERQEVPMAFAAIENSIEGSVNATLDVLAFESELLIQREVVMPIELHLLGLAGTGQEGTGLGEIREVLSYPQAFGQCRDFMRQELPLVKQIIANSTAEAADVVASGGDRGRAAIGTRLAANIHGLEILREGVEDHHGNATRFVAVAKGYVPEPSGADKTSLVLFQRENKPGSLLGILQEFADQAIDLTKLQSRPTKKALGEYCFVIDFQGHINEAHVSDCLEAISANHADIKFLGSYPVARPV